MWDKEVVNLPVYTGKEEKPQAFGKWHKFLSRQEYVQNKIKRIYKLIYTNKCVEYLGYHGADY
jgi:hypothetical protein